MLELEIDQALGNALDIDLMQMTVLANHISFMDKLKILTGIVTLTTFNTDQRKVYHSTIDILPPLYGFRNIVAHHQFGPLAGRRGVTFFTRQTKKSVRLNEVFWAVDDCLLRFEEIDKAASDIRKLSKALEGEKKSLANRFVELLAPGGHYGAKRDLYESERLELEGLLGVTLASKNTEQEGG